MFIYFFFEENIVNNLIISQLWKILTLNPLNRLSKFSVLGLIPISLCYQLVANQNFPNALPDTELVLLMHGLAYSILRIFYGISHNLSNIHPSDSDITTFLSLIGLTAASFSLLIAKFSLLTNFVGLITITALMMHSTVYSEYGSKIILNLNFGSHVIYRSKKSNLLPIVYV